MQADAKACKVSGGTILGLGSLEEGASLRRGEKRRNKGCKPGAQPSWGEISGDVGQTTKTPGRRTGRRLELGGRHEAGLGGTYWRETGCGKETITSNKSQGKLYRGSTDIVPVAAGKSTRRKIKE